MVLLFLLSGDRFICVFINLPECNTAKRLLYLSFINEIYITVTAPYLSHLSLLTSVGYNKKDTHMKNCAHPNQVIIILYLHRVQNGKIFS